MENIRGLMGQTLVSVVNEADDAIIFTLSDGRQFKLYHEQDCCECVRIEDINGSLDDLVGSPILQAEESSSNENPNGVKPEEYQDSFTWTFYKLATVKGYVTIRWYGSSNGYYSESVDFTEIGTEAAT